MIIIKINAYHQPQYKSFFGSIDLSCFVLLEKA